MPFLKDWKPDSWQSFPTRQQPQYKNQKQFEEVLASVKKLPPLVFAGEINLLKQELAKAARGEAFILQGGDCAERFADCNQHAITSKIKILLQMSVIICYGARCPVVKIGRIGGQYAKPRSSDTEYVDGKKILSFRGDNINSFEIDGGREPDPQRLLESYYRSALTINYIRALTTGGFADLHHPDQWDLDFVNRSPERLRYEEFVDRIRDGITFLESIESRPGSLKKVDFYTSHEGLLLGYEQSQTRFLPEFDGYYNLGAHMLWIGDRTRELHGGHVEFFRGIQNPLGIKIGPTSEPKQIVDLIKVLNPKNKLGRLVLISRYGANEVDKQLPKMITAIQSEKRNVTWSVDPMHGNTIKTKENVKTRNFASILAELRKTHAIHQEKHNKLAGVHFELTGENVTECTGGAAGVTDEDLHQKYETYCDPRLNYSQSLEMAFLISTTLKDNFAVS